jgi:uncharacterized protein YkwD
MPTKTKKIHSTKRHGLHHKHGKDYKHVYWPYLPMLGLSLVIFVASLLPPTFTTGQTLAFAEGLSATSLLQATNEQREDNDQASLQLNQQLSQAAQAKANDMVTRNYWSHLTPEGEEPWIFIQDVGYEYVRAGENLAYGFESTDSTVKGWMNSQSHRDNLLDSDFTEAGFGFANATDYQHGGETTVVVAMYGRPETLPLPAGLIESTTTPDSNGVTKAESLFGMPPVVTGLLIGGLAGAALTGLFVNHGLRLRRFIKKSEKYFAAHPIFDISLIILIAAAFNFSRVVGYIH